MTPQTFTTKSGPGGPVYALDEERGASSHFLDLYELLGVPKPGSKAGYSFEEKIASLAGALAMPMFSGRAFLHGRTLPPAKTWTRPSNSSSPTVWRLATRQFWSCLTALTIRIQTQFTGHAAQIFKRGAGRA